MCIHKFLKLGLDVFVVVLMLLFYTIFLNLFVGIIIGLPLVITLSVGYVMFQLALQPMFWIALVVFIFVSYSIGIFPVRK